MHSQQLTEPQFTQPSDLVRWLGAVQAQDYGAAKWALGLRLPGSSDDAIDQVFNDGAILRTHVMRPTWHFILPEDIRWMLELTAPRVNQLSAYYYRRLALDDALFARSNDVIVKALEGGKQLTREELIAALDAAGIHSEELLRSTYIIGRAELDALICSGGRRGKQFTYALIAERAPTAKSLPRDEALATLTARYFRSHGPATLKDYSWWSGLTSADCKAGLEMIKRQLASEVIDGDTYWFADDARIDRLLDPAVYLLPNYDEYMVAYTDRSAMYDTQHDSKLDSRGNVLFNNVVVLDTRVVGIWKRTLKKASVIVTPTLFAPLDDAQMDALAAAAQRYADFLGLKLELVI